MLNKLKQMAIAAALVVSKKITTPKWSEDFPTTPGLYWLTYWTTSGWTKPVLVGVRLEYETFLVSSGEKFWGVNGSQELFNQAVTCLYSQTSWELRVLRSRWQPFVRPELPTA